MDAEPPIPVTRVAAFLRQHSHDVRNGLNSLDLEISLLRELVPAGEAQECLERVRKQARTVAEQMRSLSALFQDPQPSAAPIAARELMLIWREEYAALPSAPAIQWVNKIGDERVNADAGMIATVFRELSSNAAAFSEGETATITARRDGNDVIFELREPKTAPLDPSQWGALFSTTRRHAYGLGLWQAHRLVRASGAAMTQQFLPEESALVTRIAIPVMQAQTP
jgi:K+-sensing histidine kinase KdpD